MSPHLEKMGEILGLIFFAAIGGWLYYMARYALRSVELFLRKPWDRWRHTRW